MKASLLLQLRAGGHSLGEFHAAEYTILLRDSGCHAIARNVTGGVAVAAVFFRSWQTPADQSNNTLTRLVRSISAPASLSLEHETLGNDPSAPSVSCSTCAATAAAR